MKRNFIQYADKFGYKVRPLRGYLYDKGYGVFELFVGDIYVQ